MAQFRTIEPRDSTALFHLRFPCLGFDLPEGVGILCYEVAMAREQTFGWSIVIPALDAGENLPATLAALADESERLPLGEVIVAGRFSPAPRR